MKFAIAPIPGRSSGGSTMRKRDEAKPVRVTQVEGLPFWQTRLKWVLERVEDDPYGLPSIPHQWRTSKGEPRCVRCGWLAGAQVRVRGFPVPTCADCSDEIRAGGQ